MLDVVFVMWCVCVFTIHTFSFAFILQLISICTLFLSCNCTLLYFAFHY